MQFIDRAESIEAKFREWQQERGWTAKDDPEDAFAAGYGRAIRDLLAKVWNVEP